jgi:hypothetical protein
MNYSRRNLIAFGVGVGVGKTDAAQRSRTPQEETHGD